jgi:tetratricopeptide (TPR) repeat protein
MRAIVVTAALLLPYAFASSAVAQTPSLEQKSEELRARADLNQYHGMVAVYRQGNDEVARELLTWDETRLAKAVGGIDSSKDPNRPWGDEFLRSGSLLQTAAALECLRTASGDRMMLHLNLAAEQLQRGSAALAPFASRWYYAVSRLLRSQNHLPAAEQILETARKNSPGDPLVLYESATIEEMRATEWQSARVGIRTGSGSSFRDANALDDILKDRTARLLRARDWLRQSVATRPTTLSRLHFGRVLMMRMEDDEALQQLEGVRRETSDRASQYLAHLFIAAVHERKGRLDEAASAYRQAIDCFPESDVAYIALSEVLQAAGHGDEARTILRDFLNPRGERHEPWSWYFLEPRSIARERMDALIAEGRR